MNLQIHTNVPLKDKNWFKTGGPARYFCEPTTPQQFQEALTFAKNNNLAMFILGQGANIVVSNAGFDGLVIRPQLNTISYQKQTDTTVLVTAGAGVTMDRLIQETLNNNITGLEDFSAIPSSVGGAVYINLHYFDKLISQFLVSAELIETATGTLITVENSWFNFGYDQSTLMQKNYYLVSATLQLKKSSEIETAFAQGRRTEISRHRLSRYPHTNTCGSFFRNFHDDEVTLTSNGKKVIWVAYYLDKLGIKGALQVGGARVSYQHANMLVTDNNATSADIINLARTMQQKVQDAFGIIPQPECIFVGFDTYPLL